MTSSLMPFVITIPRNLHYVSCKSAVSCHFGTPNILHQLAGLSGFLTVHNG